ncbi:uncharacterized protein LOC130636913 [Hydractinia symbiolongicarpus]|uniref:uncharacterized protein LOC130636913 n=1 Tax=Hydractinia symbiolongicarpus TaxID=13093 RepID=UPI002551185C|nr:uncharacterized protein LOC130636913 [Hydractinia symbiolongicarpus]
MGLVRPKVKTLVEEQVVEMGSAKVQLSLWIMWKKKTNMGEANDEYIEVKIDFHKLRLTRGSSYIEPLNWIALKNAIMNPKNDDEECFKWGVIASLHHTGIEKDAQRITKLRPYVDLYNWEGIEFPTTIKDISKFEKNNSDIAVNVLYIMGKKINILRRSEHNIRRSKQANLLLITDDKKTHYIAVKSLPRLLGKETSKNRNAMHFCLSCLQAFNTVESRDKHYVYCKDHELEWPITIQGIYNIYADFESLLIPVEDARETKTKKLNKHVPSGWCTYSTFAYGSVPDPLTVYRGKDCVTRFVNHLEDEVKRLYNTYPQQPMLELTEVLRREHNEASECYICLKPFDDCENNRKVRDHCHYTGLYKGAAHNSCILKYNIPSHITVIFHNLSGYDAHMYHLQVWGTAMGKRTRRSKSGLSLAVESCPQAWQIGKQLNRAKCRCLNTTKQLNQEKLKANVPSMTKFIKKDDVFRLMLRKGVYPYEYMDGWRRFEEVELPPKEAFYSKLNMKGISYYYYKYTKKVWNCITPEGDVVTMDDYHDVYLTTDVLLLADVFETFRDVCLTNYKLDPAHFYSTPGLAWKAALKLYTGKPKQIIGTWDSIIILMKNPPTLQYLDANNLYGWAMRQDLPTDGFKWVSNVEAFTEKRIEKLVEKNKHGYILEVDIDYPDRLHDTHNKLPFLPERMVIKKVENLVPNLKNKRGICGTYQSSPRGYKTWVRAEEVPRVIQFNQKLITNEDKYMNLVMKPNFKGGSRFSKHLLGVEIGKTEVRMNKPVYIGQAILDMSKMVMYEFHYDYMQPKYGSKLQLCYMDTDSFVYHICTEDFYRDIARDVEDRLDTNAYSKDDNRPLPLGKNKKRVGLIKKELAGKIMTEFITLRAKLYAYNSLTKEGVTKKFITITGDVWRRVLTYIKARY